jgi:hypothetical protein
MKMQLRAFAFMAAASVACAAPARSVVEVVEVVVTSEADEKAIGSAIDDWHDAAAKADEGRYFAHFARRAVFLGTDATERWEVAAFRAYAHPHFAQGKAWTMRATARHVTMGEGGAVAWFDEVLETKNLGPARGSGVVVREAGAWKIAQYNLAITVPNERFAEVKDLLAAPIAPPASSAK